jgi:hypothetical protein
MFSTGGEWYDPKISTGKGMLAPKLCNTPHEEVLWIGMISVRHNHDCRRRVYNCVKGTSLVCSFLVLAAGSAFTYDFYSSARQKVDLIESGRLQPGARVDLSLGELNAFAGREAPVGIRNPKLLLTEPDTVTGTALVDFGKVRRAQGYQPGWLMSKLLDGERSVKVIARVRSGGGNVTVDLKSAEISGLEIDGRTLDFLIQNFVLPFYPEAMVNRPVAMGFRIDRLQLAPSGVGVLIGR